MSDDRQALVRAVILNPREDTPRLAYADWLEEHGEPDRAEFIHVQCQMARPDIPAGERRALGRREKALRDAHERGWAPAVAFSLGSPGWDRGFVSAFAFPHALRADAVRVFDEHPVTAIACRCRAGEVGEVVAFPLLSRVELLTIYCEAVRPEDAAAVVTGGSCDHLAKLTFWTAGAVDPAARAVLRGRFGQRVAFYHRR